MSVHPHGFHNRHTHKAAPVKIQSISSDPRKYSVSRNHRDMHRDTEDS